MNNASSKRLIKPKYSTFQIISALNRAQCPVIVYDLDNIKENQIYSGIHNRLWELHKAGLIEYGRNIQGKGNVMIANITIKGSDWLANKNMMIFNTVVSVIAALAAILAIFHN